MPAGTTPASRAQSMPLRLTDPMPLRLTDHCAGLHLGPVVSAAKDGGLSAVTTLIAAAAI